jgi:hypothetical protein
MTPKQLYAAHAEAERLWQLWIGELNQDTGWAWGSDTGSATRSTRVHATRLGVVLADKVSLHGFNPIYRSAVQRLTAMGIPHGITLP